MPIGVSDQVALWLAQVVCHLERVHHELCSQMRCELPADAGSLISADLACCSFDTDQKITSVPAVTVSTSALGGGSCVRTLFDVMPASVKSALCLCDSVSPRPSGADPTADLYFLCVKTTALAS